MSENNDRAAFFDLERTLTPHAVEQEAARELWRTGDLPLRDLLRTGWIYLRYDLGMIRDFETMKRAGAVAFAGRDHARDRARFRDLFERHLAGAVTARARETVERLRGEGHAIYIVSSSYRFMVEPYAELLGADGFFGVDVELCDGRTTGRITGPIPHQHRKATIVREIAQQHGLDLTRCAAFGDSLNDLPMLEAVGHPHTVNPARGLRNIARKRGWPISSW